MSFIIVKNDWYPNYSLVYALLNNLFFLFQDGGGCPDFAESAQFRKVLQGQELLGYKAHDGTAVATSQPCEARNLQYIDERSCSNGVSNNVLGITRHGVRTPLGVPYHCSGFGESQRFQKVLQGQEVFRPYRGSLVDPRMRSSGFHQQDGPYTPAVANNWHSQQHGFPFGPPAPVLQSQSSMSPPSVLMFQQANSNVSQFEFGLGHLDKNEGDRHARFVSAEGVGMAGQALSLQPHLFSGEVIDGHVTAEKLHTPPDNRDVAPNSCKIFGISLAEKVRARDGIGCGDANFPSPIQSLKQQVPKSLGNSCATVSAVCFANSCVLLR
jgi:auxin response factor